jgi:hypothetical protein
MIPFICLGISWKSRFDHSTKGIPVKRQTSIQCYVLKARTYPRLGRGQCLEGKRQQVGRENSVLLTCLHGDVTDVLDVDQLKRPQRWKFAKQINELHLVKHTGFDM